jgi:hypothetical protein
MTDNDCGRAGVFEHFRRDIAGERPGFLRVTILAADGHAAPGRGNRKLSDEGRRRTHHQLNLGQRLCARNDLSQFLDRTSEAVHFPIAGNQRTVGLHCARLSDNACDNDALAEPLPIKKRRFSKNFPVVAALRVAPYYALPL